VSRLQLLGRDNSSNVQTVLIALHEMGLEYDRHDIGGPFGGNKTPEYLRRNPNGLVPILNDGDLDVWESNAILRYLAHRYGPTDLFPEDPATRSHVDRWMDWRQTAIGPPLGQVFVGYVRMKPEDRDMTHIRAQEKKCIEYARMLDAQLAGKPFVTGAVFTFADVTLAMFFHRYFVLPFEAERPDLPHLKAWVERLRARASIKRYSDRVLT
jgi:glutathione S-transferase